MTISKDLDKLYALSELVNSKINFLKSIYGNSDDSIVERIKTLVSTEENIPISLLESPSRKNEIVVARMICMILIKEFTKLSLVNIGMHFGGRDHATVIHAIKTINDYVDTKSNCVRNYEEYRNRIRNYRDNIIVEERNTSERTLEELLGRDAIDSILDIGKRTDS
jgi:chromosomal replication initiation ATPase DnaA